MISLNIGVPPAGWRAKARQWWVERLEWSVPDFLIDWLADSGLVIGVLRLARDGELYKAAAADAEIASAALSRLHAALTSIPEDRREPTIDLEMMLGISAELKQFVMELAGKRPYPTLPKPKNRPANAELSLVVGQLAILYLTKIKDWPAVSYNRATKKYEGDFLEFALPDLKKAGYVANEQTCARAIHEILRSWPGGVRGKERLALKRGVLRT